MTPIEIIFTVGAVIGLILYILLRFDKNLKDKKVK